MLYPMDNLNFMHYVYKYVLCYHGNRKFEQKKSFISNPQTQRLYHWNVGKRWISTCYLIKVTSYLLGIIGLCVLCSHSKHKLHTQIVKKNPMKLYIYSHKSSCVTPRLLKICTEGFLILLLLMNTSDLMYFSGKCLFYSNETKTI